MKKGSGKPTLDSYVRIPIALHQRLTTHTRRFLRRSMNMLILTAIEEYVNKLEAKETVVLES